MKKYKSIIALSLAATLVVSGTATAPRLQAAQERQTLSLAADGGSASSGTAVTLTGDAAALKKDIDAFNSLRGNISKADKQVRIQKQVLGDVREQLEYYAAHVLYEKNSKITKYGISDLETINPEELLILAGKKLSIYNYEYEMMAPEYSAKPVVTIKNVVEVRVKNAKKGLFTVKTKKGKTVSYVSYKYLYDSARKRETYSAVGDVCKKGSKQISSKAFNKYVKSYKKQKPVEMEDLFYASYSDGYADAGYLFLMKNSYILDTSYQPVGAENPISVVLVLHHTPDDTELPYTAFIQTDNNGILRKHRFVFGDDEKDWKGLRDRITDIAYFIKPLGEAIGDTTMIVSRNEYMSTKDNTVYSLSFKPVDGAEADYGYLVSVDESGNKPIFKSVEMLTSANVVEEKYEFHYDDAADMDGELYEPGSEAEVYAYPDYVNSLGYGTRTLKVDVNGTMKEFKTCDSVGFCLFSVSGKFSGTIDGQLLDPIVINATTPNFKTVWGALNPRNKDGGFDDPEITDLKWTPNA